MGVAAIVVLAIPLVYSLVSALIPRGAEAAQFLERPGPEHKACVKDTTYMRYHHWQLLRTIREEVVRYGERGEIGLHMCGECHKSRERFCNRCHNAVSLYPDCFDCHYYPEPDEAPAEAHLSRGAVGPQG